MNTKMTIEEVFEAMQSRPDTHWRTVDQMIEKSFPEYPNRQAWAHGLAISFNQTIGKGYDPGQMERMYIFIEKLIQWDKEHNAINFIDLDIMEEARFLINFVKLRLRNGAKEAVIFKNRANMFDFIEATEKTGFKNYSADVKELTVEFDFMSTEHRIYARTNFDVTFTIKEKV